VLMHPDIACRFRTAIDVDLVACLPLHRLIVPELADLIFDPHWSP
jgi:hypothetical protein